MCKILKTLFITECNNFFNFNINENIIIMPLEWFDVYPQIYIKEFIINNIKGYPLEKKKKNQEIIILFKKCDLVLTTVFFI